MHVKCPEVGVKARARVGTGHFPRKLYMGEVGMIGVRIFYHIYLEGAVGI